MGQTSMVLLSVRFRWGVALLGCLLFTAATAGIADHAFGYSQLVIFGDSLSDVGNDRSNSFGFAVDDPYWQGRFSDGPVYVEYLADLLGLPSPTYSENGGTNHAHGGAQVLENQFVFSWVIDSMEEQKVKYLDANQGMADPDALFIVLGGGNDVRAPSVDLVDTAADLVSIVDDLIDAGATNFVVPNLPDLGMTPEVTQFNGGAGAASTARVTLFNDEVDAGLVPLAANANIHRFDVFGLINDLAAEVTASGSSHGFTNVTDDCWEGGPTTATSGMGLGDGFFTSYPVCDNPAEYLFWDIIHPTTAAHEFLAEELFASLTAIDADFDDDGALDCTDIDSLVTEIASGGNDQAFDLTGDGIVDLNDRDAWLSEAGANNLASGNAYLPGDATLDGSVDGQDFLAWNGRKFTSVAAWCSGDFNADGEVNGADFIAWNANKFTSADTLVAVPEPSNLTLRLVLVLGLAAGQIRLWQPARSAT